MYRRRTKIPADLTSFVGRAGEQQRVATLVGSGARLVTLTGLGGFGKTRLARECARALARETSWDGGVWYCDVSRCRDRNDLIGVLAASLGVIGNAADPADQPPETLVHELGSLGRALVVMDGVQPAHDAVIDTLSELLASAHELVILATSRERLGIPGEHWCAVGPLPVPTTATDRAGSPAFELFMQRAQAVSPAVGETTGSLEAIAELVGRLDGNPLAIELAAARAGLMSARQLLDHMGERYAVHGASGAIVEPALHVMIADTWASLSEPERTALAELAVFVGGASLDAAEEVLTEAVSGGEAGGGLALLQSLLDKSLVVTSVSPWLPDVRRIDLLESIRAFALAAPERDASAGRARHAAWVERRVVGLESELLGKDARDASRRMAAELGNALAVVEAGLDAAAPAEATDRALRVLLAIRRVLSTSRPSSQVIALFERGWRASAAGPASLRALIGARLAHVASCSRPNQALQEIFLASEAAARASEDPQILAQVLVVSGGQRSMWSPEHAEPRLRAACDALDGFPPGPLLCLAQSGHGVTLTWLGRHPEADARFAHAARIANALDAPLLLSIIEAQQGAAALAVRRWSRASEHFTAALAAARSIVAVDHECALHRSLGECAMALGELTAARDILEQALRLGRSLGAVREIAAASLMLAAIVHVSGERELAQSHYQVARSSFAGVFGHPVGSALSELGLAACAAERLDRETAEHRLAHAAIWVAEAADPVLDEGLALLRHYIAGVLGDATPSDTRARTAECMRRAELAAATTPPPPRLPYVRMAFRLSEQRWSGEAPPPLGPSRRVTEGAPAIRIAADGSGFALPGAPWVLLGRKAAARRVLALLARHRHEAPGRPVTLDEVFEAGWPGQQTAEPHRSNRVYVLITQLRGAGLGGLLEHNGDGYLLSVALPTTVEPLTGPG